MQSAPISFLLLSHVPEVEHSDDASGADTQRASLARKHASGCLRRRARQESRQNELAGNEGIGTRVLALTLTPSPERGPTALSIIFTIM